MAYILVVEDDKSYGDIYEAKLSAAGYEVKVVSNGEKGISEARVKKPDLILLDVILPVKNGWEVLAQLRADKDFAQTPIVILSVLGWEEDRDRARKLGATDYLVKTELTIEELVNKVAGYLAPGK